MVKKSKDLWKILSIGTVIATIQVFFLIGATTGYFPESFFRKTLIFFVLTLGIFGFGAIATAKFERKLFNTSFIKVLPKFLLFAGITLAILFAIGLILKPEITSKIFGVLQIPLYVVLFHALIVAVNETMVFQVFFPNQFKFRRMPLWMIYIVSSILFASFHWWAAGGAFWLILPYIPLGILFLAVKNKWGWIATCGVHWSYNIFLLGFI